MPIRVKTSEPIVVTQDTPLKIESEGNTVITPEPINREMKFKENVYTLVPSSFIDTLKGMPAWLRSAVASSVESSPLLGDLRNYVRNLENGVHSSINRVKNDLETTNTLVITNKTASDAALSAIVMDLTTRVTVEDTQATVTAALVSEFTGTNTQASTWFTNTINTYASDNLASADDYTSLYSSLTTLDGQHSATATAVDQLYTKVGVNADGTLNSSSGYIRDVQAQVDGVSAAVLTTEGAFVGTHIWDGSEDVVIGMLKFDGNVQYQYLGGLLGANNDGWVQTDVSASLLAGEAHAWAGGASKLIHDPNDPTKITGWSFADGSGVQSQFKISAENILMDGAVTFAEYGADVSKFTNDAGYTDDTVANNAKNIANSKISASQVNTNVTSIDGGVITTGIINAASLSIDGVASVSPGYYQNFMSTDDYVTLQLENTRSGSGGTTLKVSAGTGSGCYAASFVGKSDHAAVYISNTEGGPALTVNDLAEFKGGVTGISYSDVGAAASSHSHNYASTSHTHVELNNGSLKLKVQSDENLVLYKGSTALWQSETGTSDEKLKTNITRVTADAAHVINALEVAEFEWKESSVLADGGKIHVGFIAQAVEPVVPSAVTSFPGNKIVKQLQFMPYVVKGLQEVISATITTVDKSTSLVVGDVYTIGNTRSSSSRDKTVVGVAHSPSTIRATGRGVINVCAENGNIAAGDFICSSNEAGKGMKQDDDLLHNYTVAKALEDVIWDDEEETTKMIACTYHCG